MCGIAGALHLRGGSALSPEEATRMAAQIAHRGPDAEGAWRGAEGQVVLLHRRLSVIDLSTGDQPMRDETGRYTIVFNGEIYNYRALRERLERRGHVFGTSSDTEVLLRHLMECGADGITALRGMFAFAFWDAERRSLLLARDRAGKKPLFYHQDGARLLFASTLGSLESVLRRRPLVDPAGVESFLRLGYIPAPSTIYRGVRKLGAGTMLQVEEGGIQVRPYWSFAEQTPPFEGDYGDALDRLDGLLRQAVALRLQSDVPLGVFLSGGIDSSLITALATEMSDAPIETFSIAFGDQEFDESSHAAAVAEALGTRHHAFHGKVNLLDLLPLMVRHFGEPFGDATALPTWLLARESRPFVTVALSGDGGDEGFGGYDWYFTADRLRRLARWLPAGMASPVADVGSYLGRSPWPPVARLGRALHAAALPDAERFAALRSFVSPLEPPSLLDGELLEAHAGGDRPGELARMYRDAPGQPFRRMRTVDVRSYLADCLLPKVDVATMAHGLEARAPLLDQVVLSFALSLPDAWMKDEGGGKPLLRDLLARYLPRRLFERPKQGFTVPLRPWLANGLEPRVEALASSERLLDTGWFKASGIQSLAREHAMGARDHSQRLFNLIVLDEWLSRT